MGEFRMPSLGADMEAGTLVEWMKRPGDPVKRGDVVAVVETQKGAIEIEVFETGTIERLLVQPGAKVPVGTPLAFVRGVGETPGVPPVVPSPVIPPPKPAIPAPPVPSAPPPVRLQPTAARPLASPAARKLAIERGIDLMALKGSGSEGAIVSADVLSAKTEGELPKRRGLDFDAMRLAIAAAMARSKREIPHYYLTHTIDITETLTWLETTNAGRAPPVRLLLTVLFVKAVALAVKAMPEFNGFYENGVFQPSTAVHAGVAVAIRGGGLIAPAIHDADQKSLGTLMADLRDLVARVRTGRLRSSELSDPTITISSLGERGVEGLWGVIYPPQVAIIGFGAVVRRPWIVEDHIASRSVTTVSLGADHRVSDGHRGSLLLLEIERLLKQPVLL